MNIIGHQKIISFFDRLLKDEALHHAYVFVGPKHIGKKALAFFLASKILSTPVEKLSLHPDFLQITRLDDEGDLKKDITVDHIEKITKKIIQPPLMSKRHCVIVDESEKMNLFAANSLLKTLEEPPTPTTFFLLAESEEKLLGTIRSRVQCIFLERLSSAELLNELQEKGLSNKEVSLEEIAFFSRGLPGLALHWISNTDAFEIHKKEWERFFSLFEKPLYEKIALVEDLFSDKKAHIEGRAELDEILRIWLGGAQFLLEQDSQKVQQFFPRCPQVSPGTVVPFCDTILQAQDLLAKNIHPRLLIEHILLCLP